MDELVDHQESQQLHVPSLTGSIGGPDSRSDEAVATVTECFHSAHRAVKNRSQEQGAWYE